MLAARLMGTEQPKIAVHAFFGALQEYALGNMSGAQFVAAFSLDAGEQTDATTLLNRILAESSANGGLARRMKAMELERVAVLAENLIAPFNTTQLFSARMIA
jgi:hypothetical protein